MERSTVLATYRALDRLDVEVFADRFGADGSFSLANNPPVIGPAEIARALRDLFGLLAGIKHDISGLWPINEGWAMEATVHYHVRGADTVSVRGATILRTDDDEFSDVRVYTDLAPVFAAAQAAQLSAPASGQPPAPVIMHEPKGHKGAFVVSLDKARGAELTYSRAGDLLILDHTWVDERLRGQNIGAKLVEAAVAFARAEQTRIMPLCPYARSVFARRPDLRDVLA